MDYIFYSVGLKNKLSSDMGNSLYSYILNIIFHYLNHLTDFLNKECGSNYNI